MKRYADNNGDSGVAGFEIGSDRILVQFSTGSIYEYTNASAGGGNIETMKSLAISGSGLNGFIKRNVNRSYSRKIR